MDERGFAYCKIPKENVLQWQYFTEYYFRMMDMYLGMYLWDVPDSCDNRTIQMSLFYYANVLIFRDQVNGRFYSLPFTGSRLNMYYNPIDRVPINNVGRYWHCDPRDSVIIYDNYTRVPPVITVVRYCELLAEIKSTMLVNVTAQKSPYLFRGTNRQMDTLRALFKEIDNNEKALFLDKDLDTSLFQIMNMEAPERYLSLQELGERIWHEGLNAIGIPTTNTWKKERLVGAEAESSANQAIASRMPRYNCLNEGVEKLKRKFPEYPWAVRYTGDDGGDIYGSVYNDDIRNDSGDFGRDDGTGTISDQSMA